MEWKTCVECGISFPQENMRFNRQNDHSFCETQREQIEIHDARLSSVCKVMQFNLSMISTSMKIRYSRISTRKYVKFCCANGVPPKSCPHRYTAVTDPVLAVNSTSEQTQIETLAIWKGLVEVCLSRRKQVDPQDFKNQTNAKQGQFISIHINSYFHIYIYKYICTYLTETGRNRENTSPIPQASVLSCLQMQVIGHVGRQYHLMGNSMVSRSQHRELYQL
jgi:hypothetical protein